MKRPPGNPSSLRRSSISGRRWAFTLTELLIVIGIIVLFVTLALPAFNLIGGTKSIAGAENEISAMLGRARADAISVQDYRGLVIYRDLATDRYAGAVVAPVLSQFQGDYPAWVSTTTYPKFQYVTNVSGTVSHHYVSQTDSNTAALSSSSWIECAGADVTMDIEPGTDVQNFPAGVGVQVLNNWMLNSANVRAGSTYLPVGVILFGPEGNMVLHNVSLAMGGNLGTLATFSAYNTYATTPPLYCIPAYLVPTSSSTVQTTLSSSFGLIAFDKQTFEAQQFYPGLPAPLSTAGGTYTYSTSSPEHSADSWLDTNSTPLLINRYNGTLIRSE